MIVADFQRKGGEIVGFRVTGHAGYADSGEDIVCAAVSSAVQFTANTVTEFFSDDADVAVEDNLISLRLPTAHRGESSKLLGSLAAHMEFLGEDFPGTVKITYSEV